MKNQLPPPSIPTSPPTAKSLKIYSLLIELCVMLLLITAESNAAVIFNFEAVIITENSPLEPTFMAGQTITGYFEFDENTPAVFPQPEVAVYTHAISELSFLTSGGYSGSLGASGGGIVLYDDFVNRDLFYVTCSPFAGASIGNFDPVGFYLTLDDLTMTANPGLTLPLLPYDLADFQRNTIRLEFEDSSDSEPSSMEAVYANLTSLTSVPESSTLPMLALAIGAMLLFHARTGD